MSSTGTVWNLKERIPSHSQADTVNAIMRILSEVLSLNAGKFIVKMKGVESLRLKTAESEAEEAAASPEESALAEDDGIADGVIKGSSPADFSDLNPVG